MKITKRARNISNLITWVVLILLLIGCAGIIYRFTDGLKSDFKTFYVIYEGEDILTEKHDVKFFADEKYRFEVKNLKDYVEEKKTFSVKVFPYCNEETDFKYRLDGVEYLYSDVGELSESFYVEIDEDGFSITVPSSVKDVLQKKFPDQAVDLSDSFGGGVEYFRLEVTSEDGQAVNIYFSLNFGVDKVILDKTELIF